MDWLNYCHPVPKVMETVTDFLAATIVSLDHRLEEAVRDAARAHPIFHLLLNDPLTRRAFLRPRGYPGDANLLDLLYKHPASSQEVEQSNDLGHSIYAVTSDMPGARAVRNRLAILARNIDAAAERGGRRVLSVACGHMRELELSRAARSGRIEVIGMDHDPASLREASSFRDIGGMEVVRPLQREVRDLFFATSGMSDQSDLIYAAGIYDYLGERLASRLTRSLFRLLSGRGTLLVANFLPLREAGYMDAFMNWRLVYRTEAEIRNLAAAVPGQELASARYFEETEKAIGFLALERR
jgi:hypothetical protein